MIKNIKVILSVLCVLLCLSLSAVTAFAVEQTNDNGSSYEEVTDSPTNAQEPTYQPTDAPTDPPTDAPPVTDAPTDPPYEPETEPEVVYTEPATNYYFDPDVNNDYTYETNSTTSPPADLYQPNDNVDTNVLNDDDWKKIALSLQGSDGSDDGDDFSFIQKNTATGDSGHWYLYLGIAFLFLSLVGFVIAYMSWHQQKKLYAGAGGKSSKGAKPQQKGSRYNKASKSQPTQRDRSDYGDSYSQKRNTTKRKKVNRKMDDTDDIYLSDDYDGRRF